MAKKVLVLGCTGTVGETTLRVIKAFPELLSLVGVAAYGRKLKRLIEIVEEFNPVEIAIKDDNALDEVKNVVDGKRRFYSGVNCLVDIVDETEADIIVVGIEGSQALIPVAKAINRKKTVVIANKESIVLAGELLLQKAQKLGVTIYPVDSEHFALFKLLENLDVKAIKKVLITASGGPFWKLKEENLSKVTPEDALKHPVWRMGRKITIDSATFMNKALEIIEAKYLFNLDINLLDAVVHPQSLVHAVIETSIGVSFFNSYYHDMVIPITAALVHPHCLEPPIEVSYELAESKLEFYSIPSFFRRPIALAKEVTKKGGSYPAVFNGANECAVENFLQRRLRFDKIFDLVESTVDCHEGVEVKTVDEAIYWNDWGYSKAKELLEECFG